MMKCNMLFVIGLFNMYLRLFDIYKDKNEK